MPVDWSKYPDDWKEIALAVKEEADWQCECCGNNAAGRVICLIHTKILLKSLWESH